MTGVAGVLLLSAAAEAQIVMVSNISQPNNNGVTYVDETQFLAQSFTTGATPASLNQINLAMGGGSGSGFLLSLYSNVTNAPGALLETLSGPGNPSNGTFAFTSASFALAASTTYWWVATNTPSGFASMKATTSSLETALGGWSIGDSGVYGSIGDWNNAGEVYQFSVSASPIPEPSTYAAICGAAMLGLAVWRRRQRVVVR